MSVPLTDKESQEHLAQLCFNHKQEIFYYLKWNY